jgi:carotenoid cleavage dioxygenase
MDSFEDESGKIVIDIACYPELWRQNTRFKNDATLHRWTLDLANRSVTEDPLDDRSIEFPRVAEHLVGLENCFGYAVSSVEEENALVKHDAGSGASTSHDFGTERIPGEAVFVPRDSGGEDDGWLLNYVYDKPTDTSNFVVLDAADVGAAPVATVQLPQRVPFGFHGSWFAD